VGKWEVGLCETKRKILALIAGDKIMAIPVMAEKLDISKTAVENNLKKPKAKGAIACWFRAWRLMGD